MTTYNEIDRINLLTQDARQRVKDGYFQSVRESMVEAIRLIDSL